jgi:hypothetical protein
MEDPTFEKAKIEISEDNKIEYQEISVKSFKEAVDDIENKRDPSESTFCLVDIDGCLIEDNLVKLPFITHLVEPKINTTVEESFNKLVDIFDGSLAISTNRSNIESRIFNSQDVLSVIKNLIERTGNNIPVFTSLYKQAPRFFKEDIGRKYLSKDAQRELNEDIVKSPRLDSLVHYIGRIVAESDSEKLLLYSIEDWSVVSLNRKTSLEYIGKRLKEEYDIDVSIVNYVVKTGSLF